MALKYLLGIDIGTQGTKTTLFSQEGTPAADAFEPSNLISPKPGVVEQDADEIFASVINTVKSVMEQSGVKPGDVAAIGLDSQMAGIMGIGRDGEAVTCYDNWLDTRCEPYIKEMKRCEEKIIQSTGSYVSYLHGPKVLWWKHERPEIYKKIAKFVLPTTYVAGRLCGNGADKAYLDYTNMHFAGFSDALNMGWSQELLDEFGVDKDLMPPIVEPWKIIGGLTASHASAMGLLEGTPVAAGCGDQAATSLGAGITRAGQTFDVSGTTCLLSYGTERYSPDVKNKTFIFARSVVPGLWVPLAYTNGSGMCLKWFAENLAADISGGMRELDAMAKEVRPGSEELIFVPHFSGRVCPNNPSIRGSYVGLNWVHKKPHMYRAIMESIGYEYNYYFNVLTQMLGDVPSGDVSVIGGGSKSAVFSQIKADILGQRYVTLNRTDGAPLGSAVVAGYGVGLYDDFSKTMDSIVHRTGAIEPNMEFHGQYKKYSKLYEQVIDSLMPVYEQLKQD